MRVVVADDNVLLRAGLASLLERSGSAVAGQAEHAEELAQPPDRVARGGAVIDPAWCTSLSRRADGTICRPFSARGSGRCLL
jgi:hypothetical protein